MMMQRWATNTCRQTNIDYSLSIKLLPWMVSWRKYTVLFYVDLLRDFPLVVISM